MPIDSTFNPTPEEMRRIGYRVVDQIIDHLTSLPDQPAMSLDTRAGLEARLREPLPEAPSDVETLFAQLQRDVWTEMGRVNHPRFFAFIPGPGNFVSAMADALASGFNPFVGTWLEGAGPAQIELIAVDWLRQLCGLPEGAGGLFLSGGSMANLTALCAARHIKLADRSDGAVAYFSEQTHSCVERALRVLGFAPEQLRKLAPDSSYRLSVDRVREAIAADRAAGRKPFCVIATAGTTNTGAVDPLHELADLCAQENLWFHIDGAYGAAAALCEPGKRLLAGMERADSLALDPHKWLFQPFECGCLLVRDAEHLKQTFRILPEYLADTQLSTAEINFCDYGIQLTRGFRALKLWLSFKLFGVAAFREAIARGIALAETAERILRASPSFEILSPASLAIVAFRFVPATASALSDDALNDLNHRIVNAILKDAFAVVTSTTLAGRTALRLCTINPRTTEADLRATIRYIEQLGRAAAQNR